MTACGQLLHPVSSSDVQFHVLQNANNGELIASSEQGMLCARGISPLLAARLAITHTMNPSLQAVMPYLTQCCLTKQVAAPCPN